MAVPSFAYNAEKELVLGKDGAVSAQRSLLLPGEEYLFPIYFRVDGAEMHLTAQDADQLTLIPERTDGIAGAEVVALGGRLYFQVETEQRRDGQQEQAVYQMAYQESGKTYQKELSLSTGVRVGGIQHTNAGEPVQVREYMPLYTVPMQMELARMHKWRPVQFTGEGWNYRATITAQAPADFSVSREPIAAVEAMFPQAQMVFFGFPRGGSFENGTLTIQLEPEQFDGTVYAYRYLYGRLYRMPAVYDAVSGSISIQADNLGRYVLTNIRIPEATVVE